MWYVVTIITLVVNQNVESAPPPMRLTIDCGSREKDSLFRGTQLRAKPPSFNNRPDVNINSFCDLLENAIPKAVEDGKFVLLEPEDQMGFADTISPITISPPRGFVPKLPKFRIPKLRVPKIPVPNLRSFNGGTKAPRIGSPMVFSLRKVKDKEEESSAEKMEKFKKGVQKMLHFVKVLGQIDNYLSERTRIIIDKLAKTFSE